MLGCVWQVARQVRVSASRFHPHKAMRYPNLIRSVFISLVAFAFATGVASAAADAAAAAKPTLPLRIKAGGTKEFKDAEGNTWLPDQGFEGGDTIERPDLKIANTKTPAIYQSERYSMTGFKQALPNGKYTVK